MTKSINKIPLQNCKIEAGFPSFAEDHIGENIDLNQHLIKHPAATFFVRVSGNSMIGAGIFDNDLLIVDRSLNPTNGKIVIAAVDGQLTVKRLIIKEDKILLVAENEEYPPIIIDQELSLHIWGVVTHSIHSL
jgi:DNA polymerase V